MLFELSELAVQGVVLGVGDLGAVEDIVQMVVPLDFLAEPLRAPARLLGYRHVSSLSGPRISRGLCHYPSAEVAPATTHHRQRLH